ncbi:MKI67 FHA domain-interacting nucleolar phosphoprotein [Hemicordylus capensis]|uniref:MKI67 FHA domain-interacting nucleolar phosphoprotein n=1 Tax=Hemicordylus capensis TaxID=884348 RepID=UPI002302ACBB|nr:MKI67 FHA domain-interacting nucleolar phosphoprotein [Hemicordylus capensis]
MADSVVVAAAAEPAPSALLSLDPERQKEFQAKVQRVRKTAAAKVEKLTPGVIYLGHIPQGLYEPQLKEYFSQFGTVTRLRLARSKKTGGTKGYAFLEFECDEVAKIVADTMNNYLFCERLLKCQFMPPEKVHGNLFKGSEKKFSKPSHPAVSRYNRTRSAQQKAKMMRRLLKKESCLRKRLAEKGIDYDFPGFAAERPVTKKLLKSDSSMNVSVNSEDPTPVCTPTVLERRKSQPEDNATEEAEIIFKLPPSSAKIAVQKTKTKSKRKTAKTVKCKT